MFSTSQESSEIVSAFVNRGREGSQRTFARTRLLLADDPIPDRVSQSATCLPLINLAESSED
jgi:hypothetical protein